MRALAIIIGILLGATGGVIAYRAYFLVPDTTIVVTEDGLTRLDNTAWVVAGLVLFLVGAAISFFAALKRPRR